MDVEIVDLAAEGRPPVVLRIPPAGHAATLTIRIGLSGITGNDFTADEFIAAVSDGTTETALTVGKTYDGTADKTIVTIEFPGSGIETEGSFGCRWTDSNGTKRWIVTGGYERKSIVPAL